jgi:hypothetical protein
VVTGVQTCALPISVSETPIFLSDDVLQKLTGHIPTAARDTIRVNRVSLIEYDNSIPS